MATTDGERGQKLAESKIKMMNRPDAEHFHHVRVSYGFWVLGIPACMLRPEEYRRYARECLEAASALQVPRARPALRHMAQVWLRLAQEAENRARSQQDEVSEPG